MIEIKTFECNMLQENCYIVSDSTQEAVIIDCGAYDDHERAAIISYLRDNQLKLRHVLCTHGHLDHCFGNDTLFKEFGLQPEIHKNDLFLAEDMARQAHDFFNVEYNRPTPPVGHNLNNNEIITFGEHQLKVIHTPGHSPGSVTFYCAEEHVAFTGDTLFHMSIGRTDFEGSSWKDMAVSLKTLTHQLPPETEIYSGHGAKTTMQNELKSNLYLRL